MVICKIPKDMIFVSRIEKEDIWDTFPVEKGNEKTLKRAIEWASCKHWGRRIPHKEFEFPNENFQDLHLTDLEIRGEGGRAYKVVLEIDKNKFRFDLREDILMDVIKYQGIGKGGILKGPFKFVTVGSQTKLMYTDGNVYKEAVERDKERTGKRIMNEDLVIGGVYQTLNGSTAVYLGQGYQLNFKRSSRLEKFCKIEEVSKSSKKMLWYKPYFYGDSTFEQMKRDFSYIAKGNIGFGNDHVFTMSASQSNIRYLGKIDDASVISIRNNQFMKLLKFNKKLTTNVDKFNDGERKEHVYYDHVFAYLASFLFFEENEEVKIPLNVFEKAEQLFKYSMDISAFKPFIKS